MNPYNALTATCFWYAVSAEFFSLDFSHKRNPHDVAHDILDKVQKLPLLLPNRTTKNYAGLPPLPFNHEELNKCGNDLSERINNFIPSALATRLENIERKIPTSSVAEDDQFISSNRALIYNFIKKKIRTSEKWANNIHSFFAQLPQIPPQEVEIPEPIEFMKEEEPYKETNLFELLRQQAKKKVNRKDKSTKPKIPNENEIFH